MKLLRSFICCTKGAAAAEMALVAPLLIVIMFGAFEAGNLFWNQHVLSNAVRDGVRFAGRRPLADFEGCSPSADVVTDTQNVIRTGRVSGGTDRSISWTDAVIEVEGDCDDNFTQGIYINSPDSAAPFVTVRATITYDSLFGNLGFTAADLTLQADARAAVVGF